MERTRLITRRKPTAILCSDFHLRDDKPKCWTNYDEFQEEQWQSVSFIKNLQHKYQCPVFHAGDLFHHWKPSPWLLSMAIDYLPNMFLTVYGQHDLPQHNLQLFYKTGINTLERAGKIRVLPGCNYGNEPTVESFKLWIPKNETKESFQVDQRLILVWHHMTYITPPFPGAAGGQADGLLRKYSRFHLIVTGDNHQSFTTQYEGRQLVNPGSLTRQDVDQIDFQPKVYLWYAEDNTVEAIHLPIKSNVISRAHIVIKEQRNARIDAFVSRLSDNYNIGLSFDQNLEAHFNKNNTKDSVKQIIYKAME